TSLLSRATPSHERGLYMGVQQTFGGVSRVIFPILGGLAFDRIIELPFVVGGGLVLATMLLANRVEVYEHEGAVTPT
ncbi:MAG: MFS transporter, partial [Gemmatimonadaceae bacterium]|nr:MFS transporter [Gemmatimonadaceae bacterium]